MKEMISENLKQVHQNIQSACLRGGRSPADITLIAVSKTKPLEELFEAYGCGERNFGENKVQEILQKAPQMPEDTCFRMIGHLQRNKVKYIVDKVTLIHSVDSLALAKEIDKQSKKHDKVMPVLLQINMGKEESKSGFFIEEIENAILDIQSLDNVKIEGLMAVMPICDKENTIELFEQLKAKWCELKDKYNFKYLSAGMTNDYELAIEFADANIVRIGTAIFGKRSYDGNI